MWNKWIYTMFVLALGLFASCSDSSEEQLAEAGKTRTVVFRLSMEDINGRSRATWADEYTAGTATDFDTKINVGGLQVVVYTAQGNYVGKAEKVFFSKLSNSGNDDNAIEEYEFVGDVSHLYLQDNTAYKFMVFANCSDVGDMTAVGEHPYDIGDLATAIPMWGVTTYTLTTLTSQDLGTIDLLRAAAKIEVGLSDEMSSAGYSLVGVTASHYNQRGWCAPTGWNTVTVTKLLGDEVCANYHTSTQSNGLSFSVDGNKKNAVVYMPEYNNLASTIPAVTLSVTVQNTGGTSVEYKNAIDFLALPGSSTATEAVNIIRNHYYRFNVTAIKNGGLDIDYTVQDWTDGGTTDLGTYEYPTYRNPILPSLPTTDNPDPTPPTKGATMSISNPFVGYFHITAPENKNWVPTISESTTDYVLKVYNQDKTELLYSSDNSGSLGALTTSSSWYLIEVEPKSSAQVGKTVDLGITYQIGEQTSTPIYLLINGTGTETKWPGSSDPKFITIKHVEQ